MARLLSKKITKEFDPALYVDTGKVKLAAALAAAEAQQGGTVVDEAAPTFTGKSSLMAALKASVEAAAAGGPVLVDTGSSVASDAPAAATDVEAAPKKRAPRKKVS